MKRVKKVAFLLAALMLVAQVSVGLQATTVHAGNGNKYNQAKAAYKRYLNRNLFIKSSFPNGKYKIDDLDGDGTPELFFRYTNGTGSAYKVYTYRKGDGVIRVMDIKNNGKGMGMNDVKRARTLRVVTSDRKNTYVTFYRLNSRKMLILNRYQKAKNANGTTSYYKSGNNGTRIRISAATYNKKAIAAEDDYQNVFYGAKKVKYNLN